MTKFKDKCRELYIPEGSEFMAVHRERGVAVVAYLYRNDEGQASTHMMQLGEGQSSVSDDDELADSAWHTFRKVGYGNAPYRGDRPALIELH